MPAGHPPHDGIDPGMLTPAVFAAQEAAERLGLQIDLEDMSAILDAASGFPHPQRFVAEGKTEVPSIRPDSMGQRGWQLLTEFHGPGHGRIEYFTTLAWTKNLELLWYTNGSPHDWPRGTRIVHLMQQLADAISALGREHAALDAED